MKAPEDFKYSPNGYTILKVSKGDEMNDAAETCAVELGLIKKKNPPANKAKKPLLNKSAS